MGEENLLDYSTIENIGKCYYHDICYINSSIKEGDTNSKTNDQIISKIIDKVFIIPQIKESKIENINYNNSLFFICKCSINNKLIDSLIMIYPYFEVNDNNETNGSFNLVISNNFNEFIYNNLIFNIELNEENRIKLNEENKLIFQNGEDYKIIINFSDNTDNIFYCIYKSNIITWNDNETNFINNLKNNGKYIYNSKYFNNNLSNDDGFFYNVRKNDNDTFNLNNTFILDDLGKNNYYCLLNNNNNNLDKNLNINIKIKKYIKDLKDHIIIYPI